MNEHDSRTQDREDASGGSDGSAQGDGSADPIDRRITALTQTMEQLARAQQAIIETLQNQGAGTVASTAPAPGTISPTAGSSSSPAEVRRIVRDLLRERDAQHARTDARDRYVRTKMADLPDAYRRLMPETDDAGALANAERDVRKRFREDLKGALGPAGAAATGNAEIAGDPAIPGASTGDAGERPAAALDYSKLSPLQQIALGLRVARTSQAKASQQRTPVSTVVDQSDPDRT